MLAQAIADEFGVGVGQLRELGKAGELESRRVFEAILKAGDEIEAAFARTTATVGDSFVNLRTQITRYVGTAELTSSANRALAGSIQFVAENFETLADAIVVVVAVLGGGLAGQAIARAITALAALSASAVTARAALAFLGGPLGVILTAAGVGLALLATKTDLFTSAAQRARNASESLALALNDTTEATIDQAIADQQAIIAAQRRASVIRQIQALLQLRPVTPDVSSPNTDEAAEIARAEAAILRLEARRAFLRSGLTERTSSAPIDDGAADSGLDELRADADAAAEALARATAELQKLKDTAELEAADALTRAASELQKLKDAAEIDAESAQNMQMVFRDAFRGGVMAALEGDLGDFFQNWLRERAAAGLEQALDSIADVVFQLFSSALGGKGSSGNAFASFIGSFFSGFGGGKALGGPVSAGVGYLVGERGPELFLPKQPGTVIPNGMLGGKAVQVIYNETIHFQGTGEELTILERRMAAHEASFRASVLGVVQDGFGRREILRRG